MPTQNIPAALQNISKYGNETSSYVTVNGHTYGDKSGSNLGSHKFYITYISPSNPTLTAQLTIAIDSFKLIGLNFGSSGVTESTVSGWTNASATPHFIDLGWLPDYPDPIGQQLIPVYSPADGGAFGGNDAWVNNGTLNKEFTNLDFLNSTTQKMEMKDTVSNTTYNQYAYMWLPMPNDVFFVSPVVLHVHQRNLAPLCLPTIQLYPEADMHICL